MASQGSISTGDQPRATGRDVSMTQKPAAMQYRVSNVRNMAGRQPTRPDRAMRRS